MSLSQQLNVDPYPTKANKGLLMTNISAFSLSLGADDLVMNFTDSKPDFSMTIKRTFDSIKRYFLKNTNELSVCFGGFGFSLDPEGQNNPYSRFEKSRNFYYRTHNVAVTINKDGLYSLRGKEIFVPFQERIPFLETLPVMEEFADVVGTNAMVSSYENSRTVHKTMLGKKFVPVLCYESIFPLKMAEFASESDFLVVLANEFWNKNLNGSEQYLCSNVAMAIQSRTAILRSSNSGISAIIDQDGKVLVRKKGRNAGIIHASISKKQDFTFYELIAGIFYKISLIVYLGLLIITIFRSVTKTKST
jgi:apolipoprotein N-acyltransferase